MIKIILAYIFKHGLEKQESALWSVPFYATIEEIVHRANEMSVSAQ